MANQTLMSDAQTLMSDAKTKMPTGSFGFAANASTATPKTLSPDQGGEFVNTKEAIPATAIGTESMTQATPPPTSIADRLAAIESQALSLKDTIDKKAEVESGLTTETGTTPTETTGRTGMAGVGDQALQEFLASTLDGFQVSEEAQVLQQKSAEANLLAQNLQNDMTAYAKQTRETIMEMRKNPEGKSMGANQASMQNYEYERYNGKDGMADMAIAAQYALNNAEYAYTLANNAVSAEREQYNSRNQAFKDIFTLTRNDMTTSEQLTYQSQLRMMEEQTTSLADSKEAAMQRAAANGAPQEVVTAIKNAQTPQDVWAAAGTYGEDPSMGLQRESMALNWAKFDWEKNKYWNDQATQALLESNAITAEEGLAAQTRNDSLYEAGKYMTDIQNAKNNIAGLRTSTGVSFLGRLSAFDANKKRFLSDANYLLNNETFKKLAAITENTSLGAISEGELQLVQEASTKLGNYAIRDDAGNLKGFDGSHEDVLAAIIELEDAQTRYMDKIRIGALSPEEYAELGGTGTYAEPKETPVQRAELLLQESKQQAAERVGFGSSSMF